MTLEGGAVIAMGVGIVLGALATATVIRYRDND